MNKEQDKPIVIEKDNGWIEGWGSVTFGIKGG